MLNREEIRAAVQQSAQQRTTVVRAFNSNLTVRALSWSEMEEANQGAFVDNEDGSRSYSWKHHRLAMLVMAAYGPDGQRVFDNSAQDLAMLENADSDDLNAVITAVLKMNGFDAAIEEARAKLLGGTNTGVRSSASDASTDDSRLNLPG